MARQVPRLVLVVDDDEQVQSLLSHLLTRRGYWVVAVGSGADALAAARRQRPDLVLLDVHLPGLSGYDVCRELRATFGERLPILFVSGVRTEPYDRVAGLRLGANDYIIKPFAPEELLARIDRFIAIAASDAEQEPTDTAPFGLTPRELEVLRLLANGATRTDTAASLVLSTKTVASHMESILMKLAVHTQAQAVSVAFRSGLVELPRDQRAS